MRLALEPRWISRLALLPESGMGFQRVRVRLRNGAVFPRATVFNAEILEIAEPAPPFTSADIAEIELDG